MRNLLAVVLLLCVASVAVAAPTKVKWQSKGTPFGDHFEVYDWAVDGSTVHVLVKREQGPEQGKFVIFNSIDAGKSWTKSVLAGHTLDSYSIGNPLAAKGGLLLFRTSGKLLRSDDGGKTLTPVTGLTLDDSVGVLHHRNQFVIGSGKTLFSSSDGRTWKGEFDAPAQLKEIFTVGPDLFASVTGPSGYARTLRRDGEAWVDLAGGDPKDKQGILMSSGTTLVRADILAEGDDWRVSDDGGRTWSAKPLTKVGFVATNATTMFVGNESSLSSTRDAGKTWKSLSLPSKDAACLDGIIVATQLWMVCSVTKKRTITLFVTEIGT